jgi:hypothetical protein
VKSASLSSTIESLQRKVVEETDHLFFEFIDQEFCQQIDDWSLNDLAVKKKKKECIQSFSKADIQHSQHYQSGFNAYNEIVIYNKLKEFGSVEFLLSSPKESKPDYVLRTKKGYEVNIDLKTLSFADSAKTLLALQEQQRRAKDALKQYWAGNKVDIPPVSSNPFRKSGEYHIVKRATIIETLIKKVQSAYKPAQLQYQNREGILLIDTVVLQYPIFPQESLPYFLYPPYKSLMSGALWHTCFGRAGERTFDWVEFQGVANLAEPLRLDGLFFLEPRPKAIIFALRVPLNKITLLGFHRSDLTDEKLGGALYEICDFVNNEVNSNYYELSIDPISMKQNN